MNSVKDIKKQLEIAEILALYLLGKANEAQQKEVARWLAESEEHSALLKELQSEDNEKLREDFIKAVDEGRNWNGFVKKVRKRLPIYSLLKYAALFIPFLFGTYWFVKNSSKQDLQIVENTSRIAPGEKKAQLRLQSGKLIELSKTAILMVSEDATLRVENKDETLNYTYENTNKKKVAKTTVYHELFVAKGQEYHMILSDGTEVWMNSDSYLKYPVNFSGNTREVILSGEAFFHVTKNEKMPFVVKTEVMDIKVLGTEFNVTAYSREQQWQTTLVSGKVAALLHDDENTALELSPNQQLTYDEEQEKYSVQEVDAAQFGEWRNGFFVFEEETLENLTLKLSRWYNVNFFFQNEEAKEYQFSGKLPRFEDCQTALSLIEKTTDIEFVIHNNSVTVSTRR